MEEEFHFGPYVLRTGKRTVLANGQPIPLGSRAMDILIYLVRNAGELQTNAAIIKNSWPDTYVDEANLRVHISALRRALGDTKREPHYIANIPGRGYCFIGPLSARSVDAAAPFELSMEKPLPPSRLIGQEEAISSLVDQLSTARLLTVTGPGGIGKSAIARAVVERFGQTTLWVDLAEVANGELLPTIVAAKLDIGARNGELVETVAAKLNERNLLLVLDSCEHVIVHVAAFVEKAVLPPGPGRILSTSREPLRVHGERVHRVSPLELPAIAADIEGDALVAQALKSPATRLFVERADACLGGYRLIEADAPSVLDICARLDGIPLAIELAASRLETMNVEALALSLRDGFRVLSRGTRTALPRHRTLRATLDWSYDLLSQPEQETLQDLSLLRGWFTMEVATHVATTHEIDTVMDDLVSKSLVVADAKGRRTRFRLLDTTRLYAAEKMHESGRGPVVLRRTALSLTELLDKAEHEMLSRPLDEWSQDYAQHLPSFRLAADWAFADEGDGETATSLVIAALPLFFRLTSMEESTCWARKALSRLEASGGDPRSRMKLLAALGWPPMRSVRHSDKGVDAWTKVLDIAQSLDDLDFQLRATWALWVDAITSALPLRALEIAERFSGLASQSADPMDAIVGKRMSATAMHWVGRHREARDLLLEILDELAKTTVETASGRYHLDQGVTARITLARCHWILGESETAFAEIETAVNEALALKHEVSLTHVLAEAGCALALLEGKLDVAREYVSLLKDHTETLSLDLWQTYARCFEAEIDIAEGRAAEGLPLLCAALKELESAGFNNFRSGFLLAEARALSQLGRPADALGMLDRALAACRASGERWCLPELLRMKGRAILQENGPSAAAGAIACFDEALEHAMADGAVAWERMIASELDSDADLPPGEVVSTAENTGRNMRGKRLSSLH